MTPYDYYTSLNANEKFLFSERSETTAGYMQAHIFRKGGPIKRMGNELVVNIAYGSEGSVSLQESIDYFLGSPCKKLAKELEKLPSGTLEEAA